MPTLGSWLGPASTVRAADTVGQPVALLGVEGMEMGEGWGEGKAASSPLTPVSPQIVSTCGGPNIAASVSRPLLSRDAVGFPAWPPDPQGDGPRGIPGETLDTPR